MKKFIFVIMLLTFSLVSFSNLSCLHAMMDEEMPVHNFFEQLKSGNKEGVLNQLTDPIWQKKREIFYKNPQYIQHLQNIYQGSSISITNTETVNADTRRVYVEIYLAGENIPIKTSFILKRKDDVWKISKELLF